MKLIRNRLGIIQENRFKVETETEMADLMCTKLRLHWVKLSDFSSEKVLKNLTEF